MFLFQYFIQSGVFFVVPLFLSVALGLCAIDTGVRLLPLSVTLLIAAAGIPRCRPDANPRRVVRFALLVDARRDVVLLAAIDEDASAEIVTVPLLLLGLGIGALASQLGSVTVSAVPDEHSPGGRRPAEHGHEPRRLARHRARRVGPDREPDRDAADGDPAATLTSRRGSSSRRTRELSSGVPFLSDDDLQAALDEAGVTGKTPSRRSWTRTPRRGSGLCEPHWR